MRSNKNVFEKLTFAGLCFLCITKKKRDKQSCVNFILCEINADKDIFFTNRIHTIKTFNLNKLFFVSLQIQGSDARDLSSFFIYLFLR